MAALKACDRDGIHPGQAMHTGTAEGFPRFLRIAFLYPVYCLCVSSKFLCGTTGTAILTLMAARQSKSSVSP